MRLESRRRVVFVLAICAGSSGENGLENDRVYGIDIMNYYYHAPRHRRIRDERDLFEKN